MKTFIILTAITLSTYALNSGEIQEEWMKFKINYNKLYRSTLEERKRYAIFEDNLRRIEEHNALYNAGKVSYYEGINQFADITDEEFLEFIGPSKSYDELKPEGAELYEPKSVEASYLDWRDYGAVTEVKNQKQCGSCWSFASTGALEGRNKIKSGQLISLSEQNLVDCSRGRPYYNNGCNGGMMDRAFQYVRDHGITTERKYPYTATDGFCKYKLADNVLNITGYAYVRKYDERALLSAVSEGPVTIAVHSSWRMKHYTGGVFIDDMCTKTQFNHALLIVGYGYDERIGYDYWIVKNSWSSSWGENGYIRMHRGINQCGLAALGIFPKL